MAIKIQTVTNCGMCSRDDWREGKHLDTLPNSWATLRLTEDMAGSLKHNILIDTELCPVCTQKVKDYVAKEKEKA